MPDSLERFLQDLSFDLPSGLVERAKATAAADDRARSEPSLGVKESVGEGSARQLGRSTKGFWWNQEARHDRAPVLIAAMLVVAVVATLVFTARLMRPSHQVPAGIAPQAQAGSFVIAQPFFSARDAAVLVNESMPTRIAPATLEITHDGGQTWIRTGITTALAVDVAWIDSQHFVVETFAQTGPTVLQMTADGGHHWRVINTPQQPGILRFLDPLEGWFLTGSQSPGQYVLWHTLDSGAHWQQLGSGISFSGAGIGDFYFVDSKHGFISGGSPDSSGVGADLAGSLAVTEDGGVTWRLVDLPQPPGGWSQPGGPVLGCPCTLLPAMFGRQGVVLVEEPSTYKWFTYTTADGGLTWSNPRVLAVNASPDAPWYGKWQAPLDPEHWWMVDAQGMLYRTDDGGSTWRISRPTLPAGYSLEYVKPVSAGVLWGFAAASGDRHLLVRSSDAGATWSAVKSTPYLTPNPAI